MAWEQRKRGTRYFTRSRRVGAKVMREYVGCGIHGEIAEREDALRRQSLCEQRALIAGEREKWDRLAAETKTYCEATQNLLIILLQSAGYHQHQRGEWRKKRESK